MKVVIDDRSGFCFGVVRAIESAEYMLSLYGEVCSLGDIVHNRVEMQRLEGLGMKAASHEDIPALTGKCVLIRAHGEPPRTYRQAHEAGVILADATCPVVANLQKTVRDAWERMEKSGGQVVILGKRGHPEVVGLAGQIDGDVIVVESRDDLSQIDFTRPIYFLSQTTQPLELFEEIGGEIKQRGLPGQVRINDTICRQVSNRNPHLREFAAQHDVIIFVSGRESSNGKALFEVCRQANPRSHKIEEGSQLQPEWFGGAGSVGICGATSTPRWLMEEVARAVEALDVK